MKTSVILVSCLASLVLPAADDLSVAREALRDGLWEVARTHARAAIGSTDAKLVVLESLAGEGKWDEVGKTLAQWPLAKGAAFDYYRAVTRGDHKAAMDVLKQVGSDAGVVEAQLYEAELLAKAGRRDDAVVLWKNVAARTNLSDRVTALVSSNLMDPDLLAKAYSSVRTVALRRGVGLRLGTVRMKDPATAADGERLVRALVKDAPDTKGAMEAFLAIADVKIVAGDWKEAVEAYREAVEMWPDAAKLASVQENRGWALQKLSRREEALEAFRQAGELATDDAGRATALLKVGDVLPAWQEGCLDIHAVNTGRGGCTFFVLPDGTTMMVDAGDLYKYRTRKYACVPAKPSEDARPCDVFSEYARHFLPEESRDSLDYFILTH